MLRKIEYPYGAIALRVNHVTIALGFEHLWDKETAQWFVNRANDNENQKYGWWQIVPLPGVNANER